MGSDVHGDRDTAIYPVLKWRIEPSPHSMPGHPTHHLVCGHSDFQSTSIPVFMEDLMNLRRMLNGHELSE